jgi:hypothetical protein
VIGVIIGPVVLSIVLVLLELQKKLFIAEQVTPAPKKAKKRTPKKL